MQIDPSVEPMIMWYSQSCYSIFDQIGYAASLEAAESASEFNQRKPLLMREKNGKFPETDIPHFGIRSGPFCVALLTAFLVWSQHQHNEDESGNIYLPDSVFLVAAESGYRLWMNGR